METENRRLSPELAKRILRGRAGTYLLLLVIMIAGGYFRLVGINWDANQHLHPDERFITMVAEQISSVDNFSSYFNPESSTLNPLGYGFYTYGMLPLFLTRFVAETVSQTSYDEIVLVGRILSASFDLAAVFLLFLFGQKLYDHRIGLLAAALYAAAVLPVQLSHFFAVDSFATVFMLLAFLSALEISKRPRYSIYSIFGIATGLALATKVSLAPLVFIAPLSTLIYLTGIWSESDRRAEAIRKSVIGLFVAGIYSALAFRIFQPYAFSGPGFFGVEFNPRWLDILREVTNQVAGLADFPPSHHWAGRSWSYALRNLIQYGMGWSLGVTAAVAFLGGAWQLLIGRDRRHLLPVLWIGGYFLWQNSQFWRYLRYFLPVLPMAILLAAWLLMTFVRRTQKRTHLFAALPAWRRPQSLAFLLLATVLVSTYLYAFAFTRIYTRPHPRVEASKWLREQIPGPLNIVMETDSARIRIPLSFPYDMVLDPGDRWTVNFVPPEDGRLAAVWIPEVGKGVASSQAVEIEWRIIPFGSRRQPLDQKISRIEFSPGEADPLTHEVLFSPVELKAGQTYDLELYVLDGSPITFHHQVIAVETSWDDALPLRQQGFDPYGGIYRQLNLMLFEPDDENKRERIWNGLEEADWLIISSNRVYDAAPRIPHRYPLTLAYYQALFACDSVDITTCAYPAKPGLKSELGYQLTAVFESYPTLGFFTFSDQEAMESFTVYDHPKVLIFKKQTEYSQASVIDRLRGVDLGQIIPQSAKQYTDAPDALRLSPRQQQLQESSGTWSELFYVNSVLNRSPLAMILGWYLLLFVLGCLVFPLQFYLFPGLALRGYGLTRLLALFLVGYLAWLASSWQLLRFTQGTLVLTLLMLGGVSGMVIWRSKRMLLTFLQDNWRHLLFLEALFALLFCLGLVARIYNPDLWHPFRGGEKPGELAMFNAVLKTAYFPPYEPWLSGFRMNYYYFGYVLAAVPAKLLGIQPSLSFNLILPTWFAMTGMGIFTAAFNILAPRQSSSPNASIQTGSPYHAAYQVGFLALTAGLFLGNLYQLRLLWQHLPGLAANPIVDATFWARLRKAVSGLNEVISGRADLFQGNSGPWYFDASRAILNGNAAAPITEFPLFTFLYGDLHPHLLNMPLVLAAVAWMIGLLRGFGRRERKRTDIRAIRFGISLLCGGLLIGATYPTNTWDFPAVLLLGCVTVVFMNFLFYRPHLREAVWPIGIQLFLLVIVAIVSFWPFRNHFVTGQVKLEWWSGPRTPWGDYVTVHGLFLYIIVSFLMIETVRHVKQAARQWKDLTLGEIFTGRRTPLLIAIALLAIGIVGFMWGWQRDFQSALIAGYLTVWALGLIVFRKFNQANLIAMGLSIAGLGLTFLVEIVTLADDVGRMNIVFKSYLLVWFFFTIAAAVMLHLVWHRLAGWNWRWLWLLGLEVLILGALAYPLTAPLARAADRWPGMENPPNRLDGSAYLTINPEYMEKDRPISLEQEYEAIRWAQNNLTGTPTIVEGHTAEYRWGVRFSSYTGLPTLVGWRWHLQQRNRVLPDDVINNRINDVAEFYNSLDRTKALQFIDRYHVDYVIVGELEKALYEEAGLAKFEQMALDGRLMVVYPTNGSQAAVTIYEVVSSR